MIGKDEDSAVSQESDMIRIAVVDDHPIALSGIEYMLADAADITVVAAVATAEELRARLEPGSGAGYPDVIVLDLYHEGEEPCLAAVAELAAVTRVLVVSASGRAADVVGAIRAGACGYVTKNTTLQLFRAAIYTAAGGGFWLSAQLADILQSELAGAPRPEPGDSPQPEPGPVPLAPREEETLTWIARGFTHAQVATRMGISRATVETYVERIRAKLQVGNKAELTREALTRAARREQP
jgi:two-component system nitrate/nitrite response regulator NarL